MIIANIAIQLLCVMGQYSKKSLTVKLQEAAFCIFFLRPVVDAFRVGMNKEDHDNTVDRLTELMVNKVRERATTRTSGSLCELFFYFFWDLEQFSQN